MRAATGTFLGRIGFGVSGIRGDVRATLPAVVIRWTLFRQRRGAGFSRSDPRAMNARLWLSAAFLGRPLSLRGGHRPRLADAARGPRQPSRPHQPRDARLPVLDADPQVVVDRRALVVDQAVLLLLASNFYNGPARPELLYFCGSGIALSLRRLEALSASATLVACGDLQLRPAFWTRTPRAQSRRGPRGRDILRAGGPARSATARVPVGLTEGSSTSPCARATDALRRSGGRAAIHSLQ